MNNSERDFEIEIANMYLDGMSTRRIADRLGGISHVTIHYHLVNKLKHYNPALAEEVKIQMKARIPKSIDEEEVQKRIFESFDLLINSDWTLDQIAAVMGVTINTTERDLTSRLDLFHRKYPEKVSEQMVMMASSRLTNHARRNLTPSNEGAFVNQSRDTYGRFAK